MKKRLLLLLVPVFIYTVSFSQVASVKTENGEYHLNVYSENIIRLSYKPNGYTHNEQFSDAVIMKPQSEKPVVKKGPAAGDVEFQYRNLSIRYRDKRFYFGKNEEVQLMGMNANDGSNAFRFALKPGEKIFGGGERAISLDRRGARFNLYNNPWYGYGAGADNLNFSVPFFTSSDGYGLFFDNVSKGYADIGKTDPVVFETGFSSGDLNVFIILGKDYRDILSSYHRLTGTQPLPPKWVMGNLMSRFGYSSQLQAENIVKRMQRLKIPLDAIIFDLFWFGDSIKGTLGNLDWVNRRKWPDPVDMISRFKKNGINSVLIAEPFFLKGTRTYAASEKFLAVDSSRKPFELKDFYFGYGGLLDVFRKDAADWIWRTHYKRQIANGVNAWWTDLGEPEKHPSDMRHDLSGLGIKRLLGADEVHNAYGHYWNRMLYSNYAKEFPGSRLFHLNRSGFAGSQRYSIFPWSGDVSRSWEGLRAQLPVMLGMSMSGIPYIHADAGGFAGGSGDNELYVRWLQFAAFTPVFRPHGTALGDIDKNAFSFPSEPALIAEPFRFYAKDVIKLRYSMLPYNYTLAYQQAIKGDPLVAPLYFQFPGDTNAVKVEDQFMWGDALMIAPVLEKDAQKRNVYLPQGKWYAFRGNELLEGGNWKEIRAGIADIPLFVKAGSIIPMAVSDKGNNISDFDGRQLEVHYYYADKATKYVLYEDDGINKNAIVQKQFSLLTFKANPANNQLHLSLSSSATNFKGKIGKRSVRFVVHGPAQPDLTIETAARIISPLVYSDKGSSAGSYYSFTIEFDNKPVSIRIK